MLFTVPPHLQAERHHSITGDVRRIEGFHSRVLGNDRRVWVYLPPDYEKSRERYPVLYMADGQNLFDGMTSFLPNQEWRCDETAESLIRAKLIPPIIIVGVDNAGAERADEYLPTRAKLPKSDQEIGGRAADYARMLLTELKPQIDTTYRTKPGRESTAVGGSSLGGLLSLYLGLTHSDAISKVLAVSPSLWWDNRLMLRQIEALPGKLPLQIWLDSGTEESDNEVADVQAAEESLKAKGWREGKDVTFFVDYGANHNEEAWARRFPAMLLYLYRK